MILAQCRHHRHKAVPTADLALQAAVARMQDPVTTSVGLADLMACMEALADLMVVQAVLEARVGHQAAHKEGPLVVSGRGGDSEDVRVHVWLELFFTYRGLDLFIAFTRLDYRRSLYLFRLALLLLFPIFFLPVRVFHVFFSFFFSFTGGVNLQLAVYLLQAAWNKEEWCELTPSFSS